MSRVAESGVLFSSGVSLTTLLALYEKMVTIRLCEEALLRVILDDGCATDFSPVRGQEGVAAGMSLALRKTDRLITTHRSMHDLIAKGVPLPQVLGEILRRSAGPSHGKAGSLHVMAPDFGVIFSTGVPGAGIPVAVGAALAIKAKGSSDVVAVSFGDGATNTGVFHESANLAAVLGLPVVMVCQNNLYSGGSAAIDTMRVSSVSTRAHAYGMPGETVDGNDPVAVKHVVGEAVRRARDGGGPSLVECVTFRLAGDSIGDRHEYIPDDEMAAALEEDPLPRFTTWLRAVVGVNAHVLADISDRVAARVNEAVLTVLNSSPSSRDVRAADVYANSRGIPK